MGNLNNILNNSGCHHRENQFLHNIEYISQKHPYLSHLFVPIFAFGYSIASTVQQTYQKIDACRETIQRIQKNPTIRLDSWARLRIVSTFSVHIGNMVAAPFMGMLLGVKASIHAIYSPSKVIQKYIEEAKNQKTFEELVEIQTAKFTGSSTPNDKPLKDLKGNTQKFSPDILPQIPSKDLDNQDPLEPQMNLKNSLEEMKEYESQKKSEGLVGAQIAKPTEYNTFTNEQAEDFRGNNQSFLDESIPQVTSEDIHNLKFSEAEKNNISKILVNQQVPDVDLSILSEDELRCMDVSELSQHQWDDFLPSPDNNKERDILALKMRPFQKEYIQEALYNQTLTVLAILCVTNDQLQGLDISGLNQAQIKCLFPENWVTSCKKAAEKRFLLLDSRGVVEALKEGLIPEYLNQFIE